MLLPSASRQYFVFGAGRTNAAPSSSKSIPSTSRALLFHCVDERSPFQTVALSAVCRRSNRILWTLISSTCAIEDYKQLYNNFQTALFRTLFSSYVFLPFRIGTLSKALERVSKQLIERVLRDLPAAAPWEKKTGVIKFDHVGKMVLELLFFLLLFVKQKHSS